MKKLLYSVCVALAVICFATLNANENNNSSSVISESTGNCFHMYDTESAGFWYLKARNNCGVRVKLKYSYTIHYYSNGQKDTYKGEITISNGSETVIASGNSRNSEVSYSIVSIEEI